MNFIKANLLILLSIFCLLALPEGYQADTQEDGWVQESGKYYYYQDQELVKGWLNLENEWYLLDKKTGEMKTDWVYDNGSWYFLQPNGKMKIGWLLDEGTWYYLGKSGSMQTGWLKDDGHWYFLRKSGAMNIGWLYDQGMWYFTRNNGAMQTGWLLDQGKWYYLKDSGALKIGWLQQGNTWYYLNQSGEMQTGWAWFENKWNYFKSNGSWVKNTVADTLKTVWDHEQLILVTSKGYNKDTAEITTYEQIDGKWYERLKTQGYIGKNGFAIKMSEGGKASPRGKYTIGTAFGRYQNPGTKLPYRQINSNDVWVDDPNSSLYNTWQKASENNGRWNSAEKMDIPAYNYGFVINYNTVERIPGAGSAIFFHVASNYTLGCTATNQNDVISILKWLNPAKKPIIIQTPESELGLY